MTGLLKSPQRQKHNQMADVQTVSRGVDAQVDRPLSLQMLNQAIGRLMDESTPL
jgi:hypothetical protein